MQAIHHFIGVRVRVTGSGVLQMNFASLDEIRTNTLPNLTLLSTTDIEPLRLGNFTTQRAQLKITTTGINETFVISRLTIFVKPVATELPA